jgi:hypothetical protein
MGMASHLGPWLLGTVKNTTGTTAGTIRNMGATVVIQSVPMVSGAVSTIILPAGAMVHAVTAYVTTGAVGTPTVSIGSTGVGTLNTAQGFNTLSVTAANVGTLADVGRSDIALTVTVTSGATGTLAVTYVVRNPDGTYAPTSFTGP